MSEIAQRDHLSVKTICQQTGINSHTLRAWERRYELVQPRRLGNGRRVYALADLEKLKIVVLLLRKGFQIGQIARHSLVELNQILAADARSSDLAEPEQRARNRFEDMRLRLERALDVYDLVRLSPLLSQAKADCSLREYIFNLILPLLQGVGRSVACETLSVGQEHALSAVIRYHLMQSLYTLSDHYALVHQSEAPKSFALATMEGNQHELGTLMAAILCASHGYRVYYLGPNIPVRALSGAVLALGANCVVLGLSPSQTAPSQIDRYLEELLGDLPQHCEVWAGGREGYAQKGKEPRLRVLGDLLELEQLLVGMASRD